MSTALLAAWSSVAGETLLGAPGRGGEGSGLAGGRSGRRGGRGEEVVASLGAGASAQPALIQGVPIAELLTRLQAGDQEALSAFYLELHDPLWRFGVMLIGSSDVAEEMVQDVFLAVWRRRERITPHDDLRAYLYAALRNAAKMRGRHTRVVRGVESAVDEQRLALPAHGQGPDAPDRRAEASEFYAAYQRALVALHDRERVAVQLRLEDDATFEEIGRVLGLSKVGARTIVLRAEEKIRALLAEYA